jgi:hypothetical protein
MTKRSAEADDSVESSVKEARSDEEDSEKIDFKVTIEKQMSPKQITINGFNASMAMHNSLFRSTVKVNGKSTLLRFKNFVLSNESLVIWMADLFHFAIDNNAMKYITDERLDQPIDVHKSVRSIHLNGLSVGEALLAIFAAQSDSGRFFDLFKRMKVTPEFIGLLINALRSFQQIHDDVIFTRLIQYNYVLPDVAPGVKDDYSPLNDPYYFMSSNNVIKMREYLKNHPEQIKELYFYSKKRSIGSRVKSLLKAKYHDLIHPVKEIVV